MSDKTQSNHPGEAVKAESHDPKQEGDGAAWDVESLPLENLLNCLELFTATYYNNRESVQNRDRATHRMRLFRLEIEKRHESLVGALRAADKWFRANYPSIPGGLSNETWAQVQAALSQVPDSRGGK